MTAPTALALSLLFALAPTAEQGTARQLFDAGSLAYRRGRYADAARAFEAAYRLMPAREVAFSLAQAQRRQYFVDRDPARLARAVALYRVYLDETPEGGRRADAVEQLQNLEPLLRQVSEQEPTEDPLPATELIVYAAQPGATASVDGGPAAPVPAIFVVTPGDHRVTVNASGFRAAEVAATAVRDRLVPVHVDLAELPALLQLRANRQSRILVDGREVGYAPLAGPLELASGKHTLSVTKPGHVAGERVIELRAGEKAAFNVKLPRTVQRDVAWGLLGTSAALAVGGAVTIGLSFRTQDRAQDIAALSGVRNISGAQRQQLADDVQARDRLRGATIGLWTTAAVTGIVALILVLTDRR